MGSENHRILMYVDSSGELVYAREGQKKAPEKFSLNLTTFVLGLTHCGTIAPLHWCTPSTLLAASHVLEVSQLITNDGDRCRKLGICLFHRHHQARHKSCYVR